MPRITQLPRADADDSRMQGYVLEYFFGIASKPGVVIVVVTVLEFALRLKLNWPLSCDDRPLR